MLAGRGGPGTITRWRSQTDSERKRLAEQLRRAREACDLTQREVARRLSIPQSTISEIETGQRRLDMAELIALADLYGRPAAWFFDMSTAGLSDGAHPTGDGSSDDPT